MNVNVQQNSAFTLSANALKIIAITAMVCDHVARNFVADESALFIILHFIGRFTAPIMFYFAVEGYHHTKNLKKYMFRLFIFAVISQIPFAYFKGMGSLTDNRYIFQLNVIFNILFGVLAIHITKLKISFILKTILISTIFILSINSDWGYLSIIIIMVFDWFRGNYKNQAMGYALIVLFYTSIIYVLLSPFTSFMHEGAFVFDVEMFLNDVSDYGMFIPIMLIGLYQGEKGSSKPAFKWFFYLFYPLHFIILGFLSRVIFP